MRKMFYIKVLNAYIANNVQIKTSDQYLSTCLFVFISLIFNRMSIILHHLPTFYSTVKLFLMGYCFKIRGLSNFFSNHLGKKNIKMTRRIVLSLENASCWEMARIRPQAPPRIPTAIVSSWIKLHVQFSNLSNGVIDVEKTVVATLSRVHDSNELELWMSGADWPAYVLKGFDLLARG